MRFRVLGCSEREAAMIRLAAQVAVARLTHGLCGLHELKPLRDCMMERLYGVRPLIVRCTECDDPEAEGFTLWRGQGDITLCRRAMDNGQQRFNVIFFHELIHACGGDELDAEGLEAHCFQGNGATQPTASDFALFARSPKVSGLVAGQFLLWHPQTGHLFVRGLDGRTPGTPLRARFQPPQQ